MTMQNVIKTGKGRVIDVENFTTNGNALVSSAYPGGIVIMVKGKKTLVNMKSCITGKFRTFEI